VERERRARKQNEVEREEGERIRGHGGKIVASSKQLSASSDRLSAISYSSNADPPWTFTEGHLLIGAI
jgi:hypothetical protein